MRYPILFASLVLLLGAHTALANEPILPVAEPVGLDEKKVVLGLRLFEEVGLSGDGSVSCASCHDLDSGGADGLPRSIGVHGQEGGINAPSVFYSALNFRQFWDGRSPTLEDQVNGPIQNPKEMGSSWEHVIQFLRSEKTYSQTFQGIYVDGVTPSNVRNAIAEFERSLSLTGSRFDLYLQGDLEAISQDEKKGYALFKDYGCVACHQGAAVGGNMFQDFGVMGDYFLDRKEPITSADMGRFGVTGNPADKFKFKVPSLRMVAMTEPYFHDGSVDTLEKAIAMMGKYQLGRNLDELDIKLIKAFLHTLAGPYKGKDW